VRGHDAHKARTRRLDERLAYVMRVSNFYFHVNNDEIQDPRARAQGGSDSASTHANVQAERTPRPPFARGLVLNFVGAVGLRIARLAYVMHYALGARAHVICTR
jgi:hypothetical protein